MRLTKSITAVARIALAFGFFLTLGLGEPVQAGVSNCCLIPCTPPEMGIGNWGYLKKIGPQFVCQTQFDPDGCGLEPGNCAVP